MIDKLILDKIYAALLAMQDAKIMLAERAKSKSKEEKDYTDNSLASDVKSAMKEAVGGMMQSFGAIDPLSSALDNCIRMIAHELLCAGGVKLDFDGAKIIIPEVPYRLMTGTIQRPGAFGG